MRSSFRAGVGIIGFVVTATLGCGEPTPRPFTPGVQPRRAQPKATARPAPEAVAPLPIAKTWKAPADCSKDSFQISSLDASLVDRAATDSAAGSTAGKTPSARGAAKATEVGAVSVSVGAAGRRARPEATFEVAAMPLDCLYAKVRPTLTGAVGVAVTDYLADRTALRELGRSEELKQGTRLVEAQVALREQRKKLISKLEAWSRAEPQSNALAMAAALVNEDDLRESANSGREAGRGLIPHLKKARDTATDAGANGSWARLLLAAALVDAGELADAKLEVAALAARPLTWANAPAVFELGRVAQQSGDDARAIAAYRLLRGSSDDGPLPTAAAWQRMLISRANGQWREVLVAALDVLGLKATDLAKDARASAALAIDHLGTAALSELGSLPAADANAIALEVSELADQRFDLAGAAAAAERAGDATRARDLRAKKAPAPTDKARLELLVARCYERPPLAATLDLDVTVSVGADGVVDATSTPVDRADCLHREAPLCFAGVKRGIHGKVQVRP